MNDHLVTGLIPRHILCLIGDGLDFDKIEAVATRVGGPGFVLDTTCSQSEPDPAMKSAFPACLTTATFTDTDFAAVDSHTSVAYLLSEPTLPGMATEVSAKALAVTAALLREAEVTAVKNESSGLTHGAKRWLALADAAAEADDEAEILEVLYRAWVKRPISSNASLFSCGMQLLNAADVELCSEDTADPSLLEDNVDLMDTFAIYLLTEEPAEHISDGEGFRTAIDAPRWILNRQRCDRYEIEDPYFNLNGYWRLTPG